MNRRELVQAVAAHTGVEPKQVDAVLRGFTDVVTAVVAKGEPVAITGFAKFAKVERAARMGRNPATGASIKIKASKKARITPLKGFKDSVMTPSLAPKLARGVLGGAPATATAKRAPATKTAAATKATPPRTAATAKKLPAKTAATKTAATKTAATKTAATKTAATKTPATRTVAAKKVAKAPAPRAR